VRRERMEGVANIKDTTEEIPPFFMPMRYKLLMKVMEDHKNSMRLGRKPMPVEVRTELAKVAKEYSEFKTAEKMYLDLEHSKMNSMQIKAIDAILFLPDYLLEETLSDSGAQAMEDESDYTPSVVYMEQIMQMFPPE
jgi:hypothetical protein